MDNLQNLQILTSCLSPECHFFSLFISSGCDHLGKFLPATRAVPMCRCVQAPCGQFLRVAVTSLGVTAGDKKPVARQTSLNCDRVSVTSSAGVSLGVPRSRWLITAGHRTANIESLPVPQPSFNNIKKVPRPDFPLSARESLHLSLHVNYIVSSKSRRPPPRSSPPSSVARMVVWPTPSFLGIATSRTDKRDGPLPAGHGTRCSEWPAKF